jgi:hypothetical protein
MRRHTVHNLSQRRLIADLLAPLESDCLPLRSRSPLTGCRITSRPRDRFSRYKNGWILSGQASYIRSLITECVLQVHTLFQSQFSTDCNLLLPLSFPSILSFPCHTIAAYVFSIFFLSLLSFPCIIPSITRFRRQFLRKMWPIQSAPLLFTLCRTFLPPWLFVIFLTRPVRLITISVQHHICYVEFKQNLGFKFHNIPKLLCPRFSHSYEMQYL